jgi:micrococcal nuclease
MTHATKERGTVTVYTTDRYDRLVGEVLLPDGRNLNQELVRAGMVWWSRQFALNDTTLQRLEEEASEPHAVPP